MHYGTSGKPLIPDVVPDALCTPSGIRYFFNLIWPIPDVVWPTLIPETQTFSSIESRSFSIIFGKLFAGEVSQFTVRNFFNGIEWLPGIGVPFRPDLMFDEELAEHIGRRCHNLLTKHFERFCVSKRSLAALSLILSLEGTLEHLLGVLRFKTCKSLKVTLE
uniref:Uncharacterized protein n=1 Tax=Cucumis melo TaxID=3656 RepID=A0A9I9EB40_CUCME